MALPELFHTEPGVEIYQGDAFSIMARMPQTKRALVLTDPPYFEATHAGARTNKRASNKLVHFKSFSPLQTLEAFHLMAGLTDRWVVSFVDFHAMPYLNDQWRKMIDSLEFVGQQPTLPPDVLTQFIRADALAKKVRFLRHGVWVKNSTGMPQISGDRPGHGWEAIAFMHVRGLKPQWHGRGRDAVFYADVVRGGGKHPTQKPQQLLTELIGLLTNPGDTVIDPFMGSGATILTARALGRKAVGIEIDSKWCAHARDKLKQLQMPYADPKPRDRMTQMRLPVRGEDD